MTATPRQSDSSHASSDAPSVALRAVSGDRAALAELGRRGGKARAERVAARKAEQAASVVLATVADMRSFLEARAGEVATSGECATAKANASARLVGALTELDGLGQLARENQRLAMECAALRARVGSGEGLRLTFADEPDDATPSDPPHDPLSVAAPETGCSPPAKHGESR